MYSTQNPKRWSIAIKKVTSPTNERTLIATIIADVACSYSMNAIELPSTGPSCALLANMNALVCDYVAKQKLGGLNMAHFIVKQLPVLPPYRYTPDLLAFIVPRVLELTYTAWDIKAFADDVWRDADEALRERIVGQWEENVAETGGHVGAEPPAWVNPQSEIRNAKSPFPYPPFKWDEERRVHLRAELDALYAHLYGLTRDELAYILDTFPIVRRKDEERFGEYRTKRLILENYDALEGRFE